MGAVTTEHDEQVATDQAAMEEAREEAAQETAAGDVETREEPDGQLAIGGPGTEPKFSTDAGGYPPNTAELVLKSTKVPWEADLARGSQVLLIVWGYVDDIVIGAKKVLPASVLRLVEYGHPELKAGEVVQALDDLKARAQYDRAVVDHAAQLAQDILDADPAATGEELAEAIRTQLYERYKIDDDAHEVTHGTDDHDEETEDGRSIGEITQDEVDSIDAAENGSAA